MPSYLGQLWQLSWAWVSLWLGKPIHLIASLFSFAVATYLYAPANGWDAAVDEILVSVCYGLLGPGVVALAFLAVGFAVAAKTLHDKQNAAISELTGRLSARDISSAAQLSIVDSTPADTAWHWTNLTIRNDSDNAAHDVRCEFDRPGEWRVDVPVIQLIPPRSERSVDISSVRDLFDVTEDKPHTETMGGHEQWLSTLSTSDGVTRIFRARIAFHNSAGDGFIAHISGESYWIDKKLHFTLLKIVPKPSTPHTLPDPPQ